jgi:hypothetical protein
MPRSSAVKEARSAQKKEFAEGRFRGYVQTFISDHYKKDGDIVNPDEIAAGIKQKYNEL